MLTCTDKLDLLNDFFAWTGGELPVSLRQILTYLETSCPLVLTYTESEEKDAIDYLWGEILEKH